ncbi:hypothetical protein NLU13_2074 [Sarocladium strictum]|uniref:Uncharacterized protein n=1 Tax=Sarocladium strictum TaxID=5046 RepID=A0AA39GSW8_SARSR|nr:hypothetical protein NLU13_2074 [Sarocladium strictum]
MARLCRLSSRRLSIHHVVIFLLLLGYLSGVSATLHHNEASLVARAEAAGSGCSLEGQWNCMTTTWQRCASGVWSVEMQMASGTRCVPSGFTDDFRIEHDGTVNGEGGTGDGGGGGVGNGPRRSVSRVLVMALGVIWGLQVVLS